MWVIIIIHGKIGVMEILHLILGFLFGILGPLFVEKISQERKRDNLKKIIFNDLRDLKKRLAPVSYYVLPRYGKLDEEKLEWLTKNSHIDFSNEIQEQLKNGVSSKKILEDLNKRGLEKSTLSNFPKMHLFAVDSHLVNLDLINSLLMSKLLEIRFHMEAYNESIEKFRELLNMTFQPGITDTNHKIISEELKNLSLVIAEKSIYIVDKINIVLEN